MSATLMLDPNLAEKARNAAARSGKSFNEVIHAALRAGLDQILAAPVAKPYRTIPRLMGLRQEFSYDNISDLIATAEREDYP